MMICYVNIKDLFYKQTENNMRCIVRKETNNYLCYIYSTGKFYIFPMNSIFANLFGEINSSELFAYDINDNMLDDLINEKEHTFDTESIKSPLVAGLMVSNICNLKCSYCIAYNGGAYTDIAVLNENIDFLVEELCRARIMGILVSGGEPTLNPKLGEILSKLSQKNFYITLDTNGILLNDDIISILKENPNIIPRISLDSPTALIHDKHRGGFDKSLYNIKRLIKNGIDVRVNTVLHNDNIRLIYDMANFICDLGIKQWHIFKLQSAFAPAYLQIDDIEVERVMQEVKSLYNEKTRIICKFSRDNDGFASFVIDPSLNCFSTKNDSKEKITFGNVLVKSIVEIWGATERDYRARHIKKYLGIMEADSELH